MPTNFKSGVTEEGVVTGNNFNKYDSENPIVKRLVYGFHKSFIDLLSNSDFRNIHDIGCGEGYWVLKLRDLGFEARGSDFSAHIINQARTNATALGHPTTLFNIKSIYNLEQSDSADLVVCCEVLEHLEKPIEALEIISRLDFNHAIFSVPNEPIWRILNCMRGKYLGSFGNTPGHLNHWSSKSFINLLKNHFDVIQVQKPFPWTMALVKKRKE